MKCSAFFSCCSSSNNGEIYEHVYDPNRGQERRRRMREQRTTMNNHPVSQNLPSTTSVSSAFDSSRRSILKRPQLERPSQTTRKSVTFSPDTKQSTVQIRTTMFVKEPAIKSIITEHEQEAKEAVVNPEPFVPIFAEKPFDYGIEGEEVHEMIERGDLPSNMIDLIEKNYPGLKHVRLASNDLAALVLFATYYRYPSESIKSSHILNFFHLFLNAFPDNLNLIQSIQADMLSYRFTKTAALNGLFSIAFKNSLYYTVEAFYTIFKERTIDYFLKESINFKNEKLFDRFLLVKPDTNPQKLVKWAVKYGNVVIFVRFMKQIESIDAIRSYFKVPLIIYIAERGYNFPGVVDELFLIESDHFDEALFISISKGNHDLFRDLIRYDNAFFAKSHDPKILDILRSIFLNTPSVVTVFESERSLNELFTNILMLDSNDPNVLGSFKEAVPDLISCKFLKDIFILSMFLNTREYMKMILSASDKLPLVFEVKHEESTTSHLGFWAFILETKIYFNTMKIVSASSSFHILHAVANPEFPRNLWFDLVKRSISKWKYIPEITFEELSVNYGFNTDLLSRSELEEMGLLSRRTWSLLELSILNFNSVAISYLKEHYDRVTIRSALNLANHLKRIVDDLEYPQKHPMPLLTLKQSLRQPFKVMKPDLFDSEDSSLAPFDKFVSKMRVNIKIIVITLA